jgi:hypothetical protein
MVDQGKPEEGEEETRHARLGCADDASKVAHEENRINPENAQNHGIRLHAALFISLD